MDIERARKITNLLNHAFNLIECDKDGWNFKELKQMVFNARNLSTWMMRYESDLKAWNLRSRSDFMLVMEELFDDDCKSCKGYKFKHMKDACEAL